MQGSTKPTKIQRTKKRKYHKVDNKRKPSSKILRKQAELEQLNNH